MMKKILIFLGILAILVVVAISKEVGRELVEFGKPTSIQIEQKLFEGFEKAAIQLNQSTPTMIDEYTRMDRVVAGPGARLTYYYTFPRYASQEIDSSWVLTNLRPVVENNVCNNKDMKLSLQYGGTYVYSYSGNDGKRIVLFEIDRNNCGFPKITP